ncbi:MAG: hypothetical protein ABIJ34_00805 [archaeon]
MEKARGISLWIMPTNGSYERLVALIKNLANKYNGPIFEPHITLLGDITRSKEDVITRAIQLAMLFRPFQISLQQTSYLDEYFRCIYAIAESQELIKMNDFSRRFYYMESGKKFMGHLSLLYGYYTEEMKKEIVKNISVNEIITVEELCVVDTNGYPEDWKIIRKISLKK